MQVSAFKRYIVFIILTVLGAFVLPKLSVKLNPSNGLPSITVSYLWPNASSYTLERDITSILEGGFGTLKGLEKLDSKSSKGSGYITLSFDKYTNIDVARFETATIIRQLYKQLPDRVSYPVISVNRPDNTINQPFLSYSINAPETPFKIQERVKTILEPIIGAIPAIDKTVLHGANPKEYVVTYNTNALLGLKLNKNDLIQAIQEVFKEQSLGEVTYLNDYITLSIQAKGAENFNWHIPIKKIGQRLVYLDELTTIREQEQEAQTYQRINGKNAISVSIYAEKQANTITLANTVAEQMALIKQQFPSNYEFVKSFDDTIFLKEELSKIYKRSLYTLAILLVFILLVSRSFKYLLVTLLSLIANLGLAFLLYYMFGVEIQLYSLAGITISLGLIIDNSIVMIDHIRHLRNKNIFIPILASTLTTVGALAIIYFLDDKYKVNLIDFALVIIINLSVSLLVALYLIPALLEHITIPERKEQRWSISAKNYFYHLYGKLISLELRFKKLTISVIILIFGIPVFMLPQKTEHNTTWYEKAYNNTLGNEWYRENIRPHIDRYLGGSFRLFSYYVFEGASSRRNEQTKLYVSAQMEKGATVHQMNDVYLGIENYLLQYNEIDQFKTNVYSGDNARMEITFKDGYQQSAFPFLLKARLVRKVLDQAGIDWNIYGVGNGFSNGSSSGEPVNFSVKAKGYNYDNLNAWADTLKTALLKHPRIQKVFVRENSYWRREASYEYRFLLDKQRLALLKSNPSNVINELKNLTLSKTQDLSLNIFGKYTPVRFESENSKTYDIWRIKNAPLDSINKPVVLKGVAEIYKAPEEENIYKENQEYIRLVQFQYTGSSKFGSRFLKEKLEELKTKLPLGYTFENSQNQFFFGNDENNNYSTLLLLILAVIYLICSVLFESFKQPFIILSVIPISFIGVFLTFYLFDFNFDQGGLACFVLLSGITVNASIFIINGFNKLQKQNPEQNKIELYLEAFKQKIFPIMLTIISTILGFIPFVKDGQNEVFWFALGVGTIGGLIFSLVGILLYLPVFTLKKQ